MSMCALCSLCLCGVGLPQCSPLSRYCGVGLPQCSPLSRYRIYVMDRCVIISSAFWGVMADVRRRSLSLHAAHRALGERRICSALWLTSRRSPLSPRRAPCRGPRRAAGGLAGGLAAALPLGSGGATHVRRSGVTGLAHKHRRRGKQNTKHKTTKHETRNTKHETRDTRHETRNTRHKT